MAGVRRRATRGAAAPAAPVAAGARSSRARRWRYGSGCASVSRDPAAACRVHAPRPVVGCRRTDGEPRDDRARSARPDRGEQGPALAGPRRRRARRRRRAAGGAARRSASRREPVREWSSSPLRRAVETATPIAAAHGLAVDIDDRLVELDYGEWDERGLRDISARGVGPVARRPHVRAARAASRSSTCAARVVDFCDEHLGDDLVVAVSHVSPIKAAVCWALDVDERATWRMFLDLASVSRIGRARRRRAVPRELQRDAPHDGRRGSAQSAAVTGIDRRAGSACAPRASTMKRPSPGPSATGIPSASSSAWSSSGARPVVVR